MDIPRDRSRWWICGWLCVAVGCLIASLPPVGAAVGGPRIIAGRADVVDGDGLRIGTVSIRLHGIDAPEFDQTCPLRAGGRWACGAEAAERLRDISQGRHLTCDPLDHDRYGRVIARCWDGGRDLAARLVSDGLAWAYVTYSSDYVATEAATRRAALGVWQADTQPPWAYRAERRARSAAASAPVPSRITEIAGERLASAAAFDRS